MFKPLVECHAQQAAFTGGGRLTGDVENGLIEPPVVQDPYGARTFGYPDGAVGPGGTGGRVLGCGHFRERDICRRLKRGGRLAAYAVAKAREVARQMVPIIAELLVRSFTVTPRGGEWGEFTWLLGAE